jgi:membrane protein YqaA with SNARE-associated domain
MLAYLTLFAWSFLAATVLPLGSEAALIAIVLKERTLALPIAVATIGNYLGACTTFLIGRGLRTAIDRRREPTQKERHAVRLVERYGSPALVLSWVPIIGDVIVAVAGGAGIRFVPFSFWTVVGKFARYVAVAWLTLRASQL